MAWMTVTPPHRLIHKSKNLAADKRRQDFRKQQLVKKLKEIAAGKDDVRQEGVGRSEPRES